MGGFETWFEEPGAYVLVDGQYGSTGKGLLAGYIALQSRNLITHVTTNAGPNSGHSAYWEDEKIVTQQIPVASVFLERMGYKADTMLNAGAVIDPDILQAEVAQYLDYKRVLVHPVAALITKKAKERDTGNVSKISGTGKGVGPAIARKIGRSSLDVASFVYMPMLPTNRLPHQNWDSYWDWERDVVFVETAQGFSLGLNTAKFYPYVTSRECTVMQALSDARIPASKLNKVVACYRTYPIRVGNDPKTAGSYSGGCYGDQKEITWADVGVEPELTTVTKRVRRVFTWSRQQFKESVAVNEPNVLFINFMNYLKDHEWNHFLANMLGDYHSAMKKPVDALYIGTGPRSTDIKRVI